VRNVPTLIAAPLVSRYREALAVLIARGAVLRYQDRGLPVFLASNALIYANVTPGTRHVEQSVEEAFVRKADVADERHRAQCIPEHTATSALAKLCGQVSQ